MPMTKAQILSRLLHREITPEQADPLAFELFIDDMAEAMAPERVSNDGRSCVYDYRGNRYEGASPVCAELHRLGKEIAEIKRGYNPVIVKYMMLFVEKTLDKTANVPGNGRPCRLIVEFSDVRGYNEEVCRPFNTAMKIENTRDGLIKGRFKRMIELIKNFLKKSGWADLFGDR